MRRTYGNIILQGTRWRLAGLEPHVSIKLKNIFPKIPKASVGPFWFDNTPEACADIEWFMSRYPLSISDAHLQELQCRKTIFLETQAEMERIMRPDYIPGNYSLRAGQTIRAYQAQAIEILHRSQALLVGDDVGLGKTYVGIGACLRTKQLPAIVVVQTHLQRQWKEKIESFSYLKAHPVKGTRPYNLPPADVYIIKYSCLAGWVDVFGQKYFKTAIFDEIQELRRGVSSAKGEAAKVLSLNSEYRLGLSATPIYNYGDEIWNIMDILNEHSLGTQEEFLREWSTDHHGRGKTIIKNPKALGSYLREKYLFLRRTKADVGQYLRPVNTIVESVGFDVQSVKSAEELAMKLALKASEGSFIERGQAARELDLMIRHMTGVSKAKYVAEFVRIVLESGEPVVLAGWHRDVYDIWRRELVDFRPAMYTGSESAVQKDRAREAFVSGDTDLFIISLRSGIGLDGLQHRCSTVVFGELDWSPQVHHQVIGRLDREGQKEPVMAIYLCSDSGSDPLMIDLLGLKACQASGIIDPSLGIQTVNSDQTRIQMLVRKYLKKKQLIETTDGEAPETNKKEGTAQCRSLFA
jgi:superfamily II DNA or RNA helicase